VAYSAHSGRVLSGAHGRGHLESGGAIGADVFRLLPIQLINTPAEIRSTSVDHHASAVPVRGNNSSGTLPERFAVVIPTDQDYASPATMQGNQSLQVHEVGALGESLPRGWSVRREPHFLARLCFVESWGSD
jgi:hypothetical protein